MCNYVDGTEYTALMYEVSQFPKADIYYVSPLYTVPEAANQSLLPTAPTPHPHTGDQTQVFARQRSSTELNPQWLLSNS